MARPLDRSDALEKAARLVSRGALDAALPEYTRLFKQDPQDWSVGNALGDLYVRMGKSDDAVAHFMGLAEQLASDGFAAKARALYRKALRLQPDNPVAQQRVNQLEKEQVTKVNPFLQRVLQTAAVREAPPAPPEVPPAPPEVPPAPPEVLPSVPPEVLASVPPKPADAFCAIELAADAAVARQDFGGAAAAIEGFLEQHPHDVRALEKLVDVEVEAGRNEEASAAECRLAEACLEQQRFDQARAIALDLCARHPDVALHRQLVERITTLAEEQGCALDPPPPFEVMTTAVPLPNPAPALSELDTDLSYVSDAFDGTQMEAATEPPPASAHVDPALEEVRNALLEDAATAAEERFAEASRLMEAGRGEEAVAALEIAICVPHLRASAGCRLARIHRDNSAAADALACLEWVAEVPPPTEESGHDLAYELALTLDALGLHPEALGVFRELLDEVGPGYRDVAARVEQLAAA